MLLLSACGNDARPDAPNFQKMVDLSSVLIKANICNVESGGTCWSSGLVCVSLFAGQMYGGNDGVKLGEPPRKEKKKEKSVDL